MILTDVLTEAQKQWTFILPRVLNLTSEIESPSFSTLIIFNFICEGYSIFQVTLWSGDALELCRNGLTKDALFDFIDTSNLSDHIGLLNILVCCGRRLKE